INLSVPDDKVMPPNGVYATVVSFDGRYLPSITNVGIRPTFDDGEQRTVETNIFDFDEDIYGKIVRVDFYKYIRPERKFASGQELMEEIQRNVVQVRAYFDGTKLFQE
ncbi:MAG: riboflavin kinase, partial [Lachnospiraceae bacterium]|nr:riboflavin kinase [Lachnospiraceae bacterium]